MRPLSLPVRSSNSHRRALAVLVSVLVEACSAGAPKVGNPGPQGPSGPPGAPGVTGATGPAGTPGVAGREGGTPTLLTNPFSGVLRYQDGDNVRELFSQSVTAPDAGALVVRVYFEGSVVKRDGAGDCLVTFSVRRDRDTLALDTRNVGMIDAPEAGRTETTVGGTLVAQVSVAANELVNLRVEAQKFSDGCIPQGAAGPTQFAELRARLEAQFFRFSLPTP